jgi:hypothetical protein
MRSVHLFPAVLCAALVLTGCDIDGWGPGDRYKDEFHYSYALAPGGRLSIENLNGSIEISGWDRNQVEISGTRYASSESLLRSIKIEIANAADSIRIRTVRPLGVKGNMGAHYVIRVPQKTELERVASSNGSVRIENVEGRGRIDTSNGAIRVGRYRGSLEARTTNGSVDVTDTSGPLVIRTSNGAVKVGMFRGDIDASTTNGRIEAHVQGADSNRPLRFETSNGSINVAVDALQNSDVRASTSNGGITLRLPAGTGARVQARTNNAKISSDFEVSSKGAISKHRLEGTIGAGGPVLDLSTSNGSIKIVKM